MKHIQPKTLQIMVAVLSAVTFSQRMIWRLCNRTNKVSIGQVNKVVNDLLQKGFVEELFRRKRLMKFEKASPMGKIIKDFDSGNATYRLSDPVGLLRYISLFRSMNELRAFNMSVAGKEGDVIKELSRRHVIFCLGTAQERFTPYFRPDKVSFYSSDPESLYEYLGSARMGNTNLSCYRIDYIRDIDDVRSILDQLFAQKDGKFRSTTRVQTVVDMFCDGKSAYTKPLLKSLWGVEI